MISYVFYCTCPATAHSPTRSALVILLVRVTSLLRAPFSRRFPVREPESGMQSKSALRQGDWMGDLDGAKILILWIEKLHLQEVRKSVDRGEAVDLR